MNSLTSAASIALLAATVLASPLQYCRIDTLLRIDFCLSLTTFHNASTDAFDVYFKASSKFPNRMGWTAFGTGTTMDSAMMFVLYPGEADDDITVSLRTTKSHAPPTLAKSGPDHQVLEVLEHDGYLDVVIVCYDCQNWNGHGLNVQASEQSFIFSSQPHQRMQSADPAKSLQLHAGYASFTIDMQATHSSGPPETPSLVDNGRKSVGLKHGGSKGPKWQTIHGLLMVLAFTLLMPTGVALLRSGAAMAFTAHWIVQLSGSIVALAAAALAMLHTWADYSLDLSVLGAHSSIGTLMAVSLLVQPILGYVHHYRFCRNRRTWVSSCHVRLGRLLLAGAWMNTMLGLYGGGVRGGYVGFWLICVAFAISIMILAPRIKLAILAAANDRRGYRKVEPVEP